jgi:hypothetical protein
MSVPTEQRSDRLPAVLFIAASALLHAVIFFSFIAPGPRSTLDLKLPQDVELGLIEPNPGAQGAAPAAPPAPVPVAKPPPQPVVKAAKTHIAHDDGIVVVDAGVKAQDEPSETALAATDSAEPAGTPIPGLGGVGSGAGPGLGFGAGGFGDGHGGPPGAVIGLHVDLEQVRNNSLILEVRAMLELIPEWERLLNGSGLDALDDFSRVFVATPNLKRSSLVVSARIAGAAARSATERLAQVHGAHAEFHAAGALQVAPWLNQGPTRRSIALVAPDQIVIARPQDVSRVLAVSAALAQRHARQHDIDRAPAPGSLLAMYEGEAAALSVEGVRELVPGGDPGYAPSGLRISLRHIDEYYAALRAYGYYDSSARAEAALPRIETLRKQLATHPRVLYLGLRTAIDEAKIERVGDTITLDARVTLHQVRYLMTFVSMALKPRGD